MTRHRRTVQLFVDTDRIRERLEAARSGIWAEERGLPGSRGGAHPALAPIGYSEIRQAFLAESASSGGKANVADYAGPDLRGWCGAAVRSRDVLVPPGGRMGLARAGPWRAAISGITPAPEREPSQAAQALRRRMDERLYAPAAYPVPRPRAAGPAVSLRQEDRGPWGQAGRLAAILWQGFRRHARTTAAAARGVLPKVLKRFSAEIALDSQGRAAFASRDPSGRIEGITRTVADRPEIGTPLPADPRGLTLLGDRRAPDRIYVARTAAVALGLYEQDGLPDRALLCGLGDEPDETDSSLARLIVQHPDARVQVAVDDREVGSEAEAFEARVLTALRKVRSREVRVTVHRSIPVELFPGESQAVSADPVSNKKDRARGPGERTGQERGVKTILSTRPVRRSRGR